MYKITAIALGLGVALGLAYDPSAALAKKQTPGEKRLAKMEPTGEVKRCLSTYRVDHTLVVDNSAILFRMKGGDWYVNRLPHKCPQLRFERSFSYTLRGLSKLCNVDIITVLTTMGGGLDRGPSCGLGKFEALRKKEDSDKEDGDKEKSGKDQG